MGQRGDTGLLLNVDVVRWNSIVGCVKGEAASPTGIGELTDM